MQNSAKKIFVLFVLLFSTLLIGADSCTSTTNFPVELNSTNSSYSKTGTANKTGKFFYINVTDPGTINIDLLSSEASMVFAYVEENITACPAVTGVGVKNASVNFPNIGDFNLVVYSTRNNYLDYNITMNFVAQLPPVVNIPDQSALVNSPYTLDIKPYITDPNNDIPTSYSMLLQNGDPVNTIAGLDFNSTTGILTGDSPTSIGAYIFKVTATDDDGISNIDEFTLYVQNISDIFCYGYSYKQQGLDFTEDNNGTEPPMLVGSVAINEPINMSIYIKNRSYFNISDLNITVFDDMNETNVEYITGTTTFVDVGNTQSTAIADIGTPIEVGPIGAGGFTFIFYDLNPKVNQLTEYIDVNLTFALAGTITQSLGGIGEVQMCSPTSSGTLYEPTYKIFNVEHASVFDPNDISPYQTYNLPTQIVKRADNFKVVSYNVNDTTAREDLNGSAWVELIRIGTFGSADADCNNPNSAISAHILVKFDNNNSANFTADTIKNDHLAGGPNADKDFYRTAIENTAFRVSYPVLGDEGALLESHNDGGGWIIDNFTDLASGVASINAGLGLPPNEQNKCYQPVVVGNHTYTTMPESCGNNADSNPIDDEQYAICLECIRGYNLRYACSRDNFAIRPEALMIKVNDQNQTNKLVSPSPLRFADNVSGVASPTGATVDLAAGYDYKMEVTATNWIDNIAAFGYAKSLIADYIWEPRTGTPVGCDESNRTTPSLDFYNGYANAESNISQVGEYRLHLIDTNWTNVDQNVSHHYQADGTTLKDNFQGGMDCEQNSTIVAATLGLFTNGCDISSNHNNIHASLAYRDYNVTFHPYYFDLNTTGLPRAMTPSVALNNALITPTSYIYMADMSKDQNMSYHLNGYIRASGYNDSNLSNFVGECYGKPIDINITKTIDVNNTLAYQFRFNTLNVNDINISTTSGDLNNTTGPVQIFLSEGNFTDLNGSINSNLNLNFFREVNSSKNPRVVSFGTYRVDCNNSSDCTFNADLINNKTTNGTLLLDHNITHYYGRTNAPTRRFIAPSGTPPVATTGQVFIYYEAFCNGTDSKGIDCNTTLLPGTGLNTTNDPRWFVNTSHTDGFGIPGTVTPKATFTPPVVTVITPPLGNHLDSMVLRYDGTKNYPYKARMENNASGWLIYNKYNAAATTNEFDVEFVNTGDWTGENNTTVTTKKRSSVITNRRSMW